MEKENRRIDWEIISKSFQNKLSEEEKGILINWLEDSPRHRDFYQQAFLGGKTDVMVGVSRVVLMMKKKELLQRVRAAKRKESSRRRLRFVWYAAAIVLPLAIAVGMWMNTESQHSGMEARWVQPGSGRAVLELHDGRSYFLDAIRVVETGIEGNVAKVEKQSLIYPKLEAKKLVYNKVIVPRAGEYSLTLSDGTRVWLNSDSEIRYPVAFDKEQRVVFLSGEAYFEVEKDMNRPFYVVMNDMEIRVYGTSFNVNTHYQNKIQTALVEGCVGIRVKSTGEEVMLRSDQMAEFNVLNRKVTVMNVDTYCYSAWKDGLFVFKKQKLQDVLDILSRWYDIDVFYQNTDLKDLHFTGTIKRHNDIAEVVKFLEKTDIVNFTINGKTLIVSR